jgi:hypothetical protein
MKAWQSVLCLWIRATLVIRAFGIRVFAYFPDLFQYHEEHQYPIRGHGRSCRAGPLSCLRSFTESRHHFDSGNYRVRPVIVCLSKNPRTFIHFPFYAFSIHAVIRRNVIPAYNESHLYSHTFWSLCEACILTRTQSISVLLKRNCSFLIPVSSLNTSKHHFIVFYWVRYQMSILTVVRPPQIPNGKRITSIPFSAL